MKESSGHVLAVGANLLWGFSPLYFYLNDGISPLRIAAYQAAFSFLTILLITWRRGGRPVLSRNIKDSLVPAVLLFLNWTVFVLAIVGARVLEAGYGYLLMPVFIMVFGTLLMREKMTWLQVGGLSLAIIALSVDVYQLGIFPLYSFALAVPFALYAVWHKRRKTRDPLGAVLNETLIIFPLAALLIFSQPGEVLSDFGSARRASWLILIGFVTFLPLFLFVKASARLSAFQLGVYQFIAPLVSTVVAIYAFKEPYPPKRLLPAALLATGIILTMVRPTRRVAVG